MRPEQPDDDESYYDTFHGRGQDEQDQHDLDVGSVELEDLPSESAVRGPSRHHREGPLHPTNICSKRSALALNAFIRRWV